MQVHASDGAVASMSMKSLLYSYIVSSIALACLSHLCSCMYQTFLPLTCMLRYVAARAGGITAAGLIAGAVIGSALQSWLRVDIVPIGVSWA